MAHESTLKYKPTRYVLNRSTIRLVYHVYSLFITGGAHFAACWICHVDGAVSQLLQPPKQHVREPIVRHFGLVVVFHHTTRSGSHPKLIVVTLEEERKKTKEKEVPAFRNGLLKPTMIKFQELVAQLIDKTMYLLYSF